MNSEYEHDIHSQLKSISASLKDLNKSIAQVEKNTRALDQEESNVSRKEGELIQVSLRISFLGIEDIDTVKQEFTCEFFLAATWREPSLTGKTVDDEIDWDREWDPEITFANAVELRSLKKKHDVSFENQVQESHRDGRHSIGSDEEDNQSHDGTPIVQLSYRVKGRFKSILDLKNFPFDFQTLNIVISSNWSDGVLVFECENVKSCSVPACQRFPNQEEWHLVNHVMCKVDSFEEEYSEFPISFSVYTFKVQIHRKYSYFINNIVILMFIITLLSFVSNEAFIGRRRLKEEVRQLTFAASILRKRSWLVVKLLFTYCVTRSIQGNTIPLFPYGPSSVRAMYFQVSNELVNRL